MAINFCIDSAPGQTLEDMARKFSVEQNPTAISEYIQALLRVNAHEGWINTFAQHPQYPLRPGTLVCLPNADEIKTARRLAPEGQRLRQALLATLHYHNRQTVTTRRRAVQAAKHYHLPTLSAVSLLTEAINSLSTHKETALGLAGGLLTLGEQTQDFVKDSAQEIRDAMLETQEKLTLYLRAPYGEKTGARQAFYEAHRQVKHKLDEYLKNYGEKRANKFKKLAFVANRDQWLNQARTGAPDAKVTDIVAYKSIVRTIKHARYAGLSFIALEVVIDGAEVYNTYRENGDWFKEMVEEAAGLGGSIFGGRIAILFVNEFLMLTPEGWVIVIVGTAGALILEEFYKHLSRSFVNFGRRELKYVE